MNTKNTPRLETERLILRRFTEDDLEAIFSIFSDKEANTYLPWYPVETMEQAQELYVRRYAQLYSQPKGYGYAVCMKADDRPVGYVEVSAGEGHDMGYGLRREFWRQGIATEACRAVMDQLRADGVQYVTATHDTDNPRSGQVMRRLGMTYKYSYMEQWQPKDIWVLFRMYQMNLDGNDSRVYRGYWNQHPQHYIEDFSE